MTTLSTHDTKRSEDVRARLAGISEIPGEWVTRRAGLARARAGELGRRTGWSGCSGRRWSGPGRSTTERLTRTCVKAAREAKLHTSWTSPDAAFEDAVAALRRGGCSPTPPSCPACSGDGRPAAPRGSSRTASGSALLQLVLPGVPDVYQGCETVSLRLVDPDNRARPTRPSWPRCSTARWAAVPDPWADLPAAKARLTALGLRLRRDHPDCSAPTAATTRWSPTGPRPSTSSACVRAGRGRRGRDAAGPAAGRSGRLAPTTASTCPAGSWTDLVTGRAPSTAPGSVLARRARRAGRSPVARAGRGLTCACVGVGAAGADSASTSSASAPATALSALPARPARTRAGTPPRSTGCAHGAGYRLAVDGGEPAPDPLARRLPRRGARSGPGLGPGGVRAGTDATGPAARCAPRAVVYELHVGHVHRRGTLDCAIEQLDAPRRPRRHPRRADAAGRLRRAARLGLRRRRAGRRSTSRTAGPTPCAGSSTRRTRPGLAVLLDVVHNHLGPSGNHWPRFGPFMTDAHRTPWGDAVNLDAARLRRRARDPASTARGAGSRDFHLDGLRLDAVHALHDDRARTYLEELAAAVADLAVELGRPLASSPSPTATTRGPYAAPPAGRRAGPDGAVGRRRPPRAALAAHRRDARATTPTSRRARPLAHDPRARRSSTTGGGPRSAAARTAGRSTGPRPDPWRFVVALQTHDQVGNRARGRAAHRARRPRPAGRRRPRCC